MRRLGLFVVIALAACSKKHDAPAERGPAIVVEPHELVRTAGEAAIPPDPDTARAMQTSGRTRVLTSWKVCVDPTGAVDEVAPIRSSGFMTWDAALAAGVHAWKFAPVVRDGKPVRACTSFTFAWSAG